MGLNKEQQIFVFISGFQENTFISNSNILSCARNSTITIVDLNVVQYSTSCPEYKQCNLTEEQTNAIKRRCNKETSCTISTIIPDTCLFNDYGHVTISYSCTETVNSSCTFENGNCGWTVSSYKKYQWKTRRGKTPRLATGPDKDHTTASEYGYFAYTKSKLGSKLDDASSIWTGLIVPSPKQCLTFWYHMYGEQINTLKVFQQSIKHNITLWEKSGNQGNKWFFQSLSLTDIGPYRIMFKAIRGNGYKSEIAVDDIFISNSDCKKASRLDCNFETELCNWNVEQESGNTWTVISGETPSDDTGPKVDHTYGVHNGHYIYLEATDMQKGQKSNLTSETVYPDGDACLTFWFHMYGDGMGTLNVYLVSEKITKKLWSRSGNKPDIWQLAFVDISILQPYQMTLEGVRDSTFESDMAIDDILLLSGACNKRAIFLDCNFETEKCNWLMETKTPYIWTISTGLSSTKDTGPDYDHTIKTGEGHYIYLNGSGLIIREGMKSKLTSTIINPGGDFCFTFWYHMFGESIGTLSVYTESGNTSQMHWSQSGNKENSWKFANFTIFKSEPYKIVFEGERGDGYESDIALDDISLLERSCSGLTKTSQSCHNIDETISLHECSKYYLQLNKTSLVFDQEFDNCSVVYHDVQTSITTLCNYMNNSDICTFYLPELIKEDNRCFQSNRLLVEYRCEVEESSTVSSLMTSREGSSKDAEITTVASVTTSKAVSNAVSDTSVTLSAAVKNSSNSATGLVVGLVIGGLILACVVILVVVLIRRHTFKSNPREKIRNNLGGNDYIGSQDIALPLTANHSSYMQNNGMYDRNSNTSVHGYDSRHAYAHINNIQHEYINIGVANGFVDKERVQAPTYALRGDKTCQENNPSNDDECAIIDSTAETSFNETIDDRTGTADKFVVLDTHDTGFKRTTFSNTPIGYEFANPIKDTENKICDEDQYAISDEGDYDHSGSNRHKVSEDNIYNHAVDTIYDSGGHKRNEEGREDTYDYFFGQKTEDDYDISTTK
ncbi:unnamed protein product [Mytilus coruscus]|uniref:MAM domain-containing protein n=1 Tax=Mytilus coruscus TaxID=42192 RepID=A0A6J8CG01_MYTCO|nr:unnamed protein product [Mytilus coruscus]